MADDQSVDRETEALAMQYAGRDFRSRRKVIEEPVAEYFDEEWALPAFLAMITDAVPAEHRDKAIVRLEGGYDGGFSLKVSYFRDETDEEVASRVRDALAYAGNVQKDERAEYERLKQRFG